MLATEHAHALPETPESSAAKLINVTGNASTKMTAADYAAAGRPDGIMINLGTNDWGHVVGKTLNNTAAFIKVHMRSLTVTDCPPYN